MANLFFTLDVPAGNGVGAPTDVSASGREKTIQVEGSFAGSVSIDVFLHGGTSWTTFKTFGTPDKQVKSIAAQLFRVRRSGVPGVSPGAPTVLVSANDDGAQFAIIPAAPASVNTEALGNFRTVTVAGVNRPVNIEVSDDGIAWNTCMTFNGPDLQSKIFTSKFMRSSRPGVIAVGGVNEGADTDELVKVTANDTTPDFLLPKLQAGPNINITEIDDGLNEKVQIEAVVPPSSDELVKVTANDTTPDFLLPKLQAGSGIALAEINDGANERVRISAAFGAAQSLFRNTSISTSSTVFSNAMDGGVIVIPEDGIYLCAFDGVGRKSFDINRLETTIWQNGVEIPEATRQYVWGELDRGFHVGGSALVAASAADEITVAYRRPSGGGSAGMSNRNLWVLKVL